MALVILFPGNAFGRPSEYSAQSLNIASVRSADISLCQCGSVNHWRSVVDEASTFVDQSKVSSVEVGWLGHRQAIESLVALERRVRHLSRPHEQRRDAEAAATRTLRVASLVAAAGAPPAGMATTIPYEGLPQAS